MFLAILLAAIFLRLLATLLVSALLAGLVLLALIGLSFFALGSLIELTAVIALPAGTGALAGTGLLPLIFFIPHVLIAAHGRLFSCCTERRSALPRTPRSRAAPFRTFRMNSDELHHWRNDRYGGKKWTIGETLMMG
jgi:hypothetical protein